MTGDDALAISWAIGALAAAYLVGWAMGAAMVFRAFKRRLSQ
jgi:hypothetical protein